LTIADLISRTFGNYSAKQRAEIDREIEEHKASMRQNAQVVQSGSRVLEQYANAMRLMVESDRE